MGYNEGNAPGTFSDRVQALKGRHNRGPTRRRLFRPYRCNVGIQGRRL